MSCSLLLDEHVAPAIASSLMASGHDALTVVDAGLRGAADEAIMEWAVGQDRIIITEDRRDFPRLVSEWNAQGRNFPGVVLFSRDSFDRVGQLTRSIEQHITSDPGRLQNSLTWLPSLQEQE